MTEIGRVRPDDAPSSVGASPGRTLREVQGRRIVTRERDRLRLHVAAVRRRRRGCARLQAPRPKVAAIATSSFASYCTSVTTTLGRPLPSLTQLGPGPA